MSDHDDPHLAAGLLKMFLRELPEPAMTYAAYDHVLELSRECFLCELCVVSTPHTDINDMYRR